MVWTPELPEHVRRSTGVRVTRCDSWDEFISELRPSPTGEPDYFRIYRGHAEPCWKLSSTWERDLERFRKSDRPFSRHKIYQGNGGYEEKRDRGLDLLKQLARTMPGIPSDSLTTDNDWWALGRHYGLETPLLDWSRSPFIAAFWAFAKRVDYEVKRISKRHTIVFEYESSEPVVVWSLGFKDWDLTDSNSEAAFQKGEFDLVDNTSYNLHRQRAQQGVFTRLEHDSYTDVESYLKCRGLGARLDRYEIPCRTMLDLSIALSDLERMNIHYGTVFPDPQGAAIQANMEKHWRMFRISSYSDSPLWGRAPVDDG